MRLPLLLDDAAVFPPGNLPLAEAVVAHRRHREAWYADLVGPLVVPASALGTVGDLGGEAPLDVAVVVPDARAAAATLAEAPDGVRVVALEVTAPDIPGLQAALGEPEGVTVYVELPRDEGRDAVIAELTGTSYRAKVRTGGVRADLYPDETELAATITALVAAGVPFKATAGLHHAARNTDPDTGFEQHGFLNLLAAAVPGADAAALLAERDPRRLPLPDHSLFGSFGTCSIAEPVEELAALEVTAR
ncbi:hypothetical protein ACFQ0K_09895 [Nocardioides caeni]|uniref:Uncharacterized protein n=1 Tax=Nocardioides caeni TaxID=574700 RepID=A0A4S8N5Q3_9ACTN|nr:hypothetical protein [Nocardioides caeni]THV11215.1 hypothetical protein E9934_13065 [Nocardioides caeni]